MMDIYLTHGYLLYILGSNTIVLYFVAQIVLDLVTEISFSWLLCPFDTPPSLFLFFFFEHFVIA